MAADEGLSEDGLGEEPDRAVTPLGLLVVLGLASLWLCTLTVAAALAVVYVRGAPASDSDFQPEDFVRDVLREAIEIQREASERGRGPLNVEELDASGVSARTFGEVRYEVVFVEGEAWMIRARPRDLSKRADGRWFVASGAGLREATGRWPE